MHGWVRTVQYVCSLGIFFFNSNPNKTRMVWYVYVCGPSPAGRLTYAVRSGLQNPDSHENETSPTRPPSTYWCSMAARGRRPRRAMPCRAAKLWKNGRPRAALCCWWWWYRGRMIRARIRTRPHERRMHVWAVTAVVRPVALYRLCAHHRPAERSMSSVESTGKDQCQRFVFVANLLSPFTTSVWCVYQCRLTGSSAGRS